EIRGLVKIYEAMKPLDAAAIFNEMEMPILLEVIDKMSERKVAPVLAGMNPKRARDVTQELAEMRKVRADLKNQAAGL
ncbi:MAG: MotE family protein, partial [Alphaproteobacteria bacterium]